MPQFHNNPNVKDGSGEGLVKRYVHQPITIEHYGLQASVKENGRVIIRSAPVNIKGSDEMEYDEVEVPASLVFKLARLLKDTRSVKFVSLAEASEKKLSAAEDN